MAERSPVVVISGTLQELPQGDTVRGATSTSGSMTPEERAEIDANAVAMAIALG